MLKTLLKIKQNDVLSHDVCLRAFNRLSFGDTVLQQFVSLQSQDLADLVVLQILLDTTGLHFTQ